jgi:hypothetical protein
MHSSCFFKCMIFRNAMMARKVGQNMDMGQDWPLRSQSYNRFMGMLRTSTDSGNDDALFLLGLVWTRFFSSLITAIYLMPIFNGWSSFTNWIREQRGFNTCSKQWTQDMMKRRTCLAS